MQVSLLGQDPICCTLDGVSKWEKQVTAPSREREPRRNSKVRDFQMRQRHGREGQICA